MINIYTVKWGFKYGPEYVNRILEMCREHITQEFKFYCRYCDYGSFSEDS